tara:strand:+ start:20522 stop:20677 length:156 start_codon:yes stop_codon:yes gene_type:complete
MTLLKTILIAVALIFLLALAAAAKRRRLEALRPHPAGQCRVCDAYEGNPTP